MPFGHEIGFHLATTDHRRTRASRDRFRVAQMVERGMRDDDQIHPLQFVRFHRAARILVEERIDQDVLALVVDEFVSGDAEEAEASFHGFGILRV